MRHKLNEIFEALTRCANALYYELSPRTARPNQFTVTALVTALSSTRRLMVVFVVSVVVILIYTHVYHEGKHERLFRKAIADKLAAREQEFLVEEVIPFKWDTVCYLSEHSIMKPEDVSRLPVKIPSDQYSEFPNLTFGPHIWAFAFTKKSRLVEILKFKSGNLRANNRDYHLTAPGMGLYPCLARPTALFRVTPTLIHITKKEN